MFLNIVYKLKDNNIKAIKTLQNVDVINKLNNNPIPIPAILPKLSKLNLVGLRSVALSSKNDLDIFIQTPWRLGQV